jgi:hypothetical protein
MKDVWNYFRKKLLLLLLFVITSIVSFAAIETIPTGSKIINMGVSPQTVANGLKPYGLVYALLKQNIPIKWVINQYKVKDGVDFSHNGVDYKASAFIIAADYLYPNIVTLINTWVAKGVVVNTSVSPFQVDVTYTIKAAPFWVMDAQNGKIAVQFLNAAEIPSSAYIFKDPSQLTGCDDIYVMPHADPTWDTHKNLYFWNKTYKGAIWAGCHAVSVLEDTYGLDSTNGNTTVRLNFLSSDGTAAPDKNLVLFSNHGNGSPPYSQNYPTHAVMQFLGSTDAAQQGGSEQVYMPYKPGGSWRPQTYIGVYDPSQADVPTKSDGPVASVLFGSAYGDPNRGKVVYEGGHDISGTSAANVAAQRVFFNASFMFVLDKQVSTSFSNIPTKLNANTTYNNFTITATSPIPNNTLTYQWTSSIGGTFSNPTGTTTNYTAPVVTTPTTAVISCVVRDACGRVSAETQGVTILPGPMAPVALPDSAVVPKCAGNITTFNVLSNDYDPNGDPMTVSLLGQGLYGTFTNQGNGIITYVPTSYAGAYDSVTYKNCDNTGLCTTSTLTAIINLKDANGCNPDQYYGVAQTITAAIATASIGAPTNLAGSLDQSDGSTTDATTYTNFAIAGSSAIYSLSSVIPSIGNLRLYTDAASNGSTFTIEQSSDSTTWTNAITFTVNNSDNFLASRLKNYTVYAGTKWIRFTSNTAGIYLDAMEYDVYGCVSAVPTLSNDAATTLEDVPVTIDVLSNDSDPLGKNLLVNGITVWPTHGSVSVNPDYTITYLNNKDQNAVDSFTYRVVNANGLLSTAKVIIKITADACASGKYQPFSGTSYRDTLNPIQDNYLKSASPTSNFGTANDFRLKGKVGDLKRPVIAFDFASTGIPANAVIDTAQFSAYITSAPANEIANIYRVTQGFTETGSTWNSNGTTAWLTPGGDYDPTIWASRSTGTASNIYLTWNVKSLVQSWVAGTYSNYGFIVKRYPEATNGTFKDNDFRSRENSNNKTLPQLYLKYFVPAACANIPSRAALAMPDTATTNSITPVTINVTANDYNYSGKALTISLITTTSAKGGTIAQSGSQLIYTPPATSPTYNGVDTFMYRITTSNLDDSAWVYVNVTNAPPSANIDYYTVASNTVSTPTSITANVRSNDYDPEGSPLTLPAITIMPKKGTATVDASGNIVYIPSTNFYGTDSLVYQIGEAITGCNPFSDTAKVIFTVTNRPPVANPDNLTTNPCEIKQAPVLNNDSDPELGKMSITITQAPGIGTATVVNNGTVIQYSPPSGVSNTTTTLKYKVCDDANPSACSASTTLTVTINAFPAVNNPPITAPDSFYTPLNEIVYADVLSNDVEPDGQLFTLPLSIVTNATKGTATPLSNGLIQYIPNKNFYGVDSFQYRVYDSIPMTSSTCGTIAKQGANGWVYITVQNAPIAYPDYVFVHKNTAATINVTANDIFGSDGPAVGTITIVTAPKGGTASVVPGTLSTQIDDQINYVPNAGFASNDTLIYKICDITGDCDTAIVIIKYYPDTDGDGVDDVIDIDDDNDGIPDYIETCGATATSFSCLPNGSDPSLDDDKDGIVNYKDADFGPLNVNGCVASLDSDGDGVPDYLDRDSDNDGIPDVVEAYGVDANGDGVIDNFTDTDGDGLSQNVDANNTGAAGSGAGLGFNDLDGDGIPNRLDLDSDNDGIPDIVEALGTDTNNDGRVDGFADSNSNGLNDAYENAGAILTTGADTNNDGRADSYPNKNADQTGRPNPYDLDSDGDGIVDAVEAGFAGSVVVSNGMVTGAATNGWANSVKALGASSLALANTDGRGPANYLDIDADDDGISDNIEGQATASYILPTGVDADNDGIDDAYDGLAGTYGAPGITPNDQDNDGTPDYKDTDADNDGLLDINEASGINALTQSNINLTDTDGDGLVDQFDVLNLKTASGSSIPYNVTNSNMGANGITSGPTPTGSNVLLVQSLPTYINRDWRIVNNLVLGNSVWYDFNANGTKDAGETGISGAIVNLYADTNGDNIADGGAIISTTTDASGNYQFTGLSSLKYIVGVILPSGYAIGSTISTTSDPNNNIDNDNNGINAIGSEVRSNNLNLTATNNTLDFGLKGTGSNGDFVWFDVNANGIQDVGETGIAGVLVTITNSGGTSVTSTTDANGFYTLPNLAPGTYTVVFTTPAGYVASPALQGSDPTKDSDPVSGSVTVTLTAGQNKNSIDAGFYQVANLGNTVWYDVNMNGIKDAGEPAVSGATVKLYLDANNDNIADGAAIATTTTNASGVYAFSNLTPNNYIVGVTLSAAYTLDPVNGGDPDNDTDNDNNGVNLVGSEIRSNAITLTSGGEPSNDGDGANGNLTLDFGLKGTGSIGDWVWNDVNGNGIQETGETGMAGVTITASSAATGTLTTITDANGYYSFTGLINGTYTLTFTTPAGYFASPAGQGSDVTLNSDPSGGSVSVALAAAQNRTDIDAGFYLPFKLGNTVWYDFNGNGVRDPQEQVVAGATVRLYADANADNNADGASGGTVLATTTTDANGIYQFTNLASGKYIVGVVLPSGYGLGTSAGTSSNPNNGIDDDNNGIKVVNSESRTNYISMNADNSTLDIGLSGTGSIGDFVWVDVNGNGIQDVGENGLAGVSVTLTDVGNNSISTTSNTSGIYSFPNIAPGTYTLSFTTPAGYYTSPAAKGGNTVKDSDPVNGSVSVTLAAGVSRTDIDAGFFVGYTLGNKIWFDINKNGSLNAGEGSFSGIVVNLYTDNVTLNTPDGPPVATTTTDASGTYQFTKLPPGNYMVSMILPTGYSPTITTATSAAPDNAVDNDNNAVTQVGSEVFTNNITVNALISHVDLGFKGAGVISDFVWNDLNNDGIQNAGEPGMTGVTVTLTIGTTSVSTTTDASGNYSFVNLVPGNYTIAFTTPAGYVSSAANVGSDDTKDSDPVGGSVTVPVNTNQTITDVDAGFFVPSTLGDLVWNDLNANGVRDAGESVISGATVKLYQDANADNIPDGTAIATTTTNASGLYSFTGLTIGKYIVGVSLTGYQAGVTISSSSNPDNNTDNDNNGINTSGSEVRSNYITLNGTNNTLDFGLFGTGSIGDYVWTDANGNGIQEAGETGLQGITVTLNNGTGITLTTTTNSSGAYSFNNLPAGTYTISFTTPPTYYVSAANQGSDATKNSDPVNGSVSVALTAGQVRTDIDAGFYPPYSLGNAIWYDFNSNGIKDANEPGLSGVTVKLYADVNGDNNADGGGGGTVLATTTTDANGNYQLTNLPVGNYIVGVTPPTGYQQGIAISGSTTPSNNTDNDNNGVKTVNSDVRTNNILLNSTNNTLDIGLIGTATVGNFVWADANGNGLQDDGAGSGIAGAAVTLTNSSGLTITTTTSSSGAYSFSNLLAGTYTVSFATPSGYYVSPSKIGTDDTKDSDPVNGSVSVTLSNGQTNNNIDAGFYIPYTLGNQVFYDFDNSGTYTSGETGISNVTVNLYKDVNADNVPDGAPIATTYTDQYGIYQFSGLSAGNYIVGVSANGYAKGATTNNSTNPNSNTDNDNNGVNVVGSEIRSNSISMTGSTIAVDFGLTGTGSIGNYAWLDDNGNGVQDAGESPISNVTVKLTNSGGITLSTLTDAFGYYNFPNIAPDTYTVFFKTPNGDFLTGPKQGTDPTKDSDPVEDVNGDGSVTVTVGPGEVADYIDAGYFIPFPLGNSVYFDINNNGVRDANEKGIPGLTVYLYDDKNFDNIPDGGPRKTTTTDATGAYLFTDLRANGYIVGVQLPAGYAPGATTSTSADPNNIVDNDNNGVVLSGSIVRTNNISVSTPRYDVDFGLKGTASVGDYVWFDANNNGLQNAGEVGISGVSVTLTHSTGASVSTTSNAAGTYSFTGLIPGTYTLTFTTPTDYSATLSNVGADDNIDSDPVNGTVSVTLTAGQVKNDVDAGFNQTFTVGDKVFYDFNNNGVLDAGETGVSGVTVKLYADANGDNIPDGAAIASTTTNASGIYQFSNLSAGKFIVGVTLPTGYVAGTTTSTSANPNNYTDNDNNGVTTVSGEVRTNYITLNGSSYTLDFGLKGTASVGDWVWIDLDNDGVQDPGPDEIGIAGVTVSISYTGGPTLTTTTDNAGNYVFSNLIPGTYTLTFTTPFGYLPSPALKGSKRNLDSDPSGGVASVTLTSGQVNNDVDAGFTPSRSLGDVVWYDLNNNGVQDNNEPGVSGASVKLYVDANADNVPDGAATKVATTNASGQYAFTGLSSNKYIVGVVLPTGYQAGTIASTSTSPNNLVDGDNNGVNIVGSEVRSNYITVSNSTNTLDIGLSGTGSVGDRVFNDVNANGIQDASEVGIAGVNITLTEVRTGATLTATTDASGNYSFSGLAPDNYTVTFTTPAGYSPSPATQGSNTSVDSDPVNGAVSITLTGGQVRTDIDAGFYQGFSVGNLVWEDFNNNGLKDALEKGLSGATVKLYVDANGDNTPDGAAIATTTTDASGTYQFSNLPLNKYIVGVVIPSGYAQGDTTSTSLDPNNNIDNDNNGINVVNGEVQTNYLSVTGALSSLDVALKGIGSIGNFVWNDLNGNGVQDVSEPGIAGVTVTVTNSMGNSFSEETNASGFYSLPNLPPGTYTVAFATPSGYSPSSALQGSDLTLDSDPVSGTVAVTLAAGQSKTDIDAGFFTLLTLGNRVWFDFNSNGTRDATAGETAIVGATVKLYADANADNVPDGAAIATTTTDATGSYQFPNLVGGKYIVGVVLPSGYIAGATIASSSDPNNLVDNDNNGVNTVAGEVRSNYINLTASTNTLDIGLGGSSSIGDLVFNDVNGNGIQDAGETGLQGVTVAITNVGGMTLTTSSNASSNYLFTNLAPGTYTISFTTPSGYAASAAGRGTDRTKDSDPSNGTVSVTVTAGQARTDIDAGFYVPFTVGNSVWYDYNNNGLKELAETGVAGATVNLYNDADANNVADGSAVATTTTDVNGNYQFTNVTSGTYLIGVTLPAGYISGTTTTTSANPDNNTDNDNNGVNVSGSQVLSNHFTITGSNNTIDIGLKGSGSIGDFVWLDNNGNGIQDAGEPGMQGVTVTLTNSASKTLTTSTDASGHYVFASLIPDTYTIHFNTPSVPGAPKVIPYIARTANVGSDRTMDSDPNAATGNVTVTLGVGENNQDIDAGYARDQDDDNDGIPNIVENKGYDPFADNDGDGVPNYLDPTQINGIPGKPLVWKDVNNDGINDYFDFDLDGILNELDLDSDNDGILDIQEARDARAVDANNDGMADGIDADGDGILSSADQDETTYGTLGLIAQDLDGDGNANFLDLDSDADGIVDYTEATGIVSAKGMVTGTDTDGDGILAENFGSNSANIADNVNGLGGKGVTVRDSDNDGVPDPYDIDSDGDGIVDNIEAQSSSTYVAPFSTDTDGDGIDDSYDNFSGLGAKGLIPVDFDADTVPDYLDLDTENDGIADNIEWQLGSSYVVATATDTDKDGLADVYDLSPGSFGGGQSAQDSDADGNPDFRDRDSDNDGVPDVVEAYGVDANGDGTIDNFSDTDGDGLSQNVDLNNTGNAGSGLGLGFVDRDGDGVRNSIDLDSDGDGIPDVIEAVGVDDDNNGRVDNFTDANGNGVTDSYETVNALIKTGADNNNDGKADSWPNKNTDGNGLPNAYDLDSDDDGIPDQVEVGFAGANGIAAGTLGADGWSDTIDALSSLNIRNTDGTGAADYLDLDSDDDGIPDYVEWQPSLGYQAPNTVDTDKDGIVDVYDTAPNVYGGTISIVDSDGDTIPDYRDLDSDNDGISDNVEAQNPYVAPTATDTDNDGILDVYDANPSSYNGGKIPQDSDADGIANYRDKDSDNDGIPDVVEAFGADTNGDGQIDNFIDADADGLADAVDANLTGYIGSGTGLGIANLDGDAVPNYMDLDSDNDGIPDIVEALGADNNNDGRVDNFSDANGNGWMDSYENSGALIITGADVNNDGNADSYPNKNLDQIGKPNPYDLDADGDGIADVVEAGFTVAISNGTVTGPYTNGWATSISSLSSLNLTNTDGRGAPDYLDIDSDDDGISDNVEAQSTGGYVVASDVDTDGDGLSDVYDVAPSSFGGNGLTPYDHDFDGTPDYLDYDTDNDGAPDINEASMIFTIDQTNINTNDSDGDGMVDQFDNLDLSTLGTNDRYKNVTNSQMGPGGNWDGPVPSGSTVQLVKSQMNGDRDWRSTYILALRIVSFSGSLQNNISQLQWNVQNEQDVDHYVIERSKDALSFEPIGQAKAKNTPSSVYDYADDVTNFNSEKIYYRIKLVNKLGATYYSNVIGFKKDVADEIKMKVYPNPVRNMMNLNIAVQAKKAAKMLIFDAGGKAVIEKSLQLEKGENTITFENMGRLAKGWYMITVVIDGKPYIQRIVKE